MQCSRVKNHITLYGLYSEPLNVYAFRSWASSGQQTGFKKDDKQREQVSLSNQKSKIDIQWCTEYHRNSVRNYELTLKRHIYFVVELNWD